jgi:ribosome-associated translation inhibitor RaiA
MFTMNLDKLNINEAELKAFIYQQLNDMEPYVGSEAVAIKMAYTNEGRFVVKMQASHEIGNIEAESTGEDIFNAISQAKFALIRSVTSLDAAIENEVHELVDETAIENLIPEKRIIH